MAAPTPASALAREAEVLAAVKKIALFAAGVASQRFMTALQEQQEVMADLADMIMQVYALDSALARARKLRGPLLRRRCRSYDGAAGRREPGAGGEGGAPRARRLRRG